MLQIDNKMKEISIAISPCPNDTFIFENIYNGKISIAGHKFEFHFMDIAELNDAATQNKFDIIKISCAHYHSVKQNFSLLQSGGAMGYGVGPLLVKAKGSNAILNTTAKIAIPGATTTANFLLKYCYPFIGDQQKTEVIFSEIEDAVITNQYDFGVLIHEGRFTYQQKGLELVTDLGALWETKENLPIPLGCIVAKTNLGAALIAQIETAITNSITNYDYDGNPIISPFIESHAQEMELNVMRQHIDLYVNDFSKNMGNISQRLKDLFL